MPSSNVDSALDDIEAEEALGANLRVQHRDRQRIAALKREIKELHGQLDESEGLNSTLLALKPTPPKARSMRPVKRKRNGKRPSAFVALASDWHTCEVVSRSQTNGMNEHNQEIGTERAWRWARALAQLIKREQETCEIRSLVLWLGGDFLVNDSLHYKSERSCDLSPHEEAHAIRDLLANIIAYLRAELDVPRMVIPTSWGNHDRSTPKMIPGHAGDYSHIQPVYRDLASWFAPDSSIEFRISEGEWLPVDVHGYGLLFHHGHQFRYGGGVGGLSVPLLRRVGTLRQDYDFRTLNIGHFHQRGMYSSGVAFTNGSLVGPNGYSMDGAMPSEMPSQIAYTIDLERLDISNYYVIWGEE